MLRQLAAELRVRAATAAGQEQEDLLFLAAEYEAIAEQDPAADHDESFAVILPK